MQSLALNFLHKGKKGPSEALLIHFNCLVSIKSLCPVLTVGATCLQFRSQKPKVDWAVCCVVHPTHVWLWEEDGGMHHTETHAVTETRWSTFQVPSGSAPENEMAKGWCPSWGTVSTEPREPSLQLTSADACPWETRDSPCMPAGRGAGAEFQQAALGGSVGLLQTTLWPKKPTERLTNQHHPSLYRLHHNNWILHNKNIWARAT